MPINWIAFRLDKYFRIATHVAIRTELDSCSTSCFSRPSSAASATPGDLRVKLPIAMIPACRSIGSWLSFSISISTIAGISDVDRESAKPVAAAKRTRLLACFNKGDNQAGSSETGSP